MSDEKLVVDGAEVTEEELRFLHEWSGQPHAGILKSDIKRGYVTALKVIRLHRTLAGLRADVDRLLSADRATAKVLCDPETGLLAKVAMLLERDRATTNRLRRDEERIAELEEQSAIDVAEFLDKVAASYNNIPARLLRDAANLLRRVGRHRVAELGSARAALDAAKEESE